MSTLHLDAATSITLLLIVILHHHAEERAEVPLVANRWGGLSRPQPIGIVSFLTQATETATLREIA
jgi:hypothetical protein